MIVAGSAVFTLYGFGRIAAIRPRFGRGRMYLAVGGLVALVLIPLAVNTVTSILVTVWTERTERATQAWLRDSPGADVQRIRGGRAHRVIEVRVPGPVPSTAALLAALHGQLPSGMRIELDTTTGEHQELGRVR